MVSLRERKARPSYAELAGVADLGQSSGSGSGSDAEGIEVAGSREAGVSAGPSRRRTRAPSTDSSGDESVYDPTTDAAQGTGRARGRTADNDEELDDEVAEEEAYESDEDEEEESIKPPLSDEDEELVAITSPRSKSASRKQVGASRLHALGRTAAGPSGLSRTSKDPSILPPAYRALVKDATKAIARDSHRPAGQELDKLNARTKLRSLRTEYFPVGPAAQWRTRLVRAPGPSRFGGKGKGKERATDETQVDTGDVFVVMDEEDRAARHEARRRRAMKMVLHAPLLTPWEAWEGEAWWPELWTGDTGDEGPAGGSSRPEGLPVGWRGRCEMDLGLGRVGRLKRDEVILLSEEDAAPWLPTMRDKNGNPHITVHMGHHEEQQPVQLGLFNTCSNEASCDRPSLTFSAGGPIMSIEWCPYPPSPASKATDRPKAYLAIATLPSLDARPDMHSRLPHSTPGTVQLWSFVASQSVTGKDSGADGDVEMDGERRMEPEMRCEVMLCLDGGPVTQVSWMPLGAWEKVAPSDSDGLPKLGILATVQLDGSVAFWSVPHPDSLPSPSTEGRIHLRLQAPLLRLESEDAVCTCIDFMTGTRIAVGFSNGHAAVWDIGDALRWGVLSPMPSIYFYVGLSSVRSVATCRVPPTDLDGNPLWGDDPTRLLFSAFDGNTVIVDTLDPGTVVEVDKARLPAGPVAWSTQNLSPLYADTDFAINLHRSFGDDQGRNTILAAHRGAVWDLGVSPYHTMVASASSDGSLIISNASSGHYHARRAPVAFQRLFELDYAVPSGEYRVTDDFMPEFLALDAALGRNFSVKSKAMAKRKEADPLSLRTAAWAPEVGVKVARWCDVLGLGGAGWVVSGTMAGVGRIDWVEGCWQGGQVPDGY